jgi:hypothetical protein
MKNFLLHSIMIRKGIIVCVSSCMEY